MKIVDHRVSLLNEEDLLGHVIWPKKRSDGVSRFKRKASLSMIKGRQPRSESINNLLSASSSVFSSRVSAMETVPKDKT